MDCEIIGGNRYIRYKKCGIVRNIDEAPICPKCYFMALRKRKGKRKAIKKI
jgi:hypothetical protein